MPHDAALRGMVASLENDEDPKGLNNYMFTATQQAVDAAKRAVGGGADVVTQGGNTVFLAKRRDSETVDAILKKFQTARDPRGGIVRGGAPEPAAPAGPAFDRKRLANHLQTRMALQAAAMGTTTKCAVNYYMGAVASLFRHLDTNQHNVYAKLARTLAEVDPLTNFIILLEPYKSPATPYLLPDHVLAGWSGEGECFSEEYLALIKLPLDAQETLDYDKAKTSVDVLRGEFEANKYVDSLANPGSPAWKQIVDMYVAFYAGNKINPQNNVLPKELVEKLAPENEDSLPASDKIGELTPAQVFVVRRALWQDMMRLMIAAESRLMCTYTTFTAVSWCALCTKIQNTPGNRMADLYGMLCEPLVRSSAFMHLPSTGGVPDPALSGVDALTKPGHVWDINQSAMYRLSDKGLWNCQKASWDRALALSKEITDSGLASAIAGCLAQPPGKPGYRLYAHGVNPSEASQAAQASQASLAAQ